ncbi:MAG: HigA family addiction module antitoxin [Treponema sp.]|nr:HigA family addiction module antitoxin [Treponema sp.]
MKKLDPIKPGEILEEEFLKGFGISAYRLAKDTGISATRISEIIHGKRKITVETALKLSKYFGNSAEFWIGIQNDYDIRIERQSLEKELSEIGNIQGIA